MSPVGEVVRVFQMVHLLHHRRAGAADVLLWRLPTLPGHLHGEVLRLHGVSTNELAQIISIC